MKAVLGAVALIVLVAGCGDGGSDRIESAWKTCKDPSNSRRVVLEDSGHTIVFGKSLIEPEDLECVFDSLDTPRPTRERITGGAESGQQTVKHDGLTYIWMWGDDLEGKSLHELTITSD